MYNGIEKIKMVIDYIEENITEEPDCSEMATKMNLSVYEFRRIFAFLVGCPISEYIRRRKLSLAALEIMNNDKVEISKLSEKYGYANQSAFTRAFCEQHGVSPTACLQDGVEVNLFTRPEFKLDISGRENIPFKIVKTEAFYIDGYTACSTITDSCCCEDVWNGFYENEIDKKLCTDKIYAAYFNDDNNVKCCIGKISEEGQKIGASRWACFKMDTVDDDIVNKQYSKIIYEWLPSANMKRNENLPVIEIYPFDMSEDSFEWEIRIPLE